MISVIITTHRRSPDVLRRAIDSVLGQTLKAGEIFVRCGAVSCEYPQSRRVRFPQRRDSDGVGRDHCFA